MSSIWPILGNFDFLGPTQWQFTAELRVIQVFPATGEGRIVNVGQPRFLSPFFLNKMKQSVYLKEQAISSTRDSACDLEGLSRYRA